MKKASLVIIIPLIVVVLFFSVVISKDILASSGIVKKSSMQDFGVCSDGKIIVGYREKIEVFQDGKILFSFKPPTPRAYRFYVENDRIVIGCSDGFTETYDVEGKFLEDSKLSYNEVKSTAQKTQYKAENGEKYTVVDAFGFKPFEIKCGNETIVRQNILDYHFNGAPFWLLWAVAFLNMVVLVIALIDKYGFRWF